MSYVNRKGDVYYVFQGVTKTGKPKYFISRKAESKAGVQIDALPVEFELYESPVDARVSVRKRVPSDITNNELEFVREQANTWAPEQRTQVVREGQFIVVYISESIGALDSISGEYSGVSQRFVKAVQLSGPKSPAFRFKLVRKKERIFRAQRFCYRGSIDDWVGLGYDGMLDELCKKYFKHLGKESFFDLMWDG